MPMNDYALVLNAGSSSLKFCVFERTGEKEWQVAARGQIEGIGTSPRISAKDPNGVFLANETLEAGVKDGHAAIDALSAWLKSKWGGARILGVGHRVVHGGRRYSQPVVLTRKILAELSELIPLALCINPTILRRLKLFLIAIRRYRKSLASIPVFIPTIQRLQILYLCRNTFATWACSDTVFMACRMNILLQHCRRLLPKSRWAASSLRISVAARVYAH